MARNKDPNFPHAFEAGPAAASANPPTPDQLPQAPDPASYDGMQAEGRLDKAFYEGGPSQGTLEYEAQEAAKSAGTTGATTGYVAPTAPAPQKGAYRALSGLVIVGRDGQRREVAGDSLFDASSEELKSFAEGRDYARNSG